MTGEMKYRRLYLCLAHSIPSPPMLIQRIHQPYHQMIWSTLYHHVIALVHRSWLHLLFTVASVHRRQVITQLALHTCNRSVKPSLVSIFSTLVTWFLVMSRMQGTPSSHVHVWTNLLCISHKRILVYLGYHSITKTKQGPFTLPFGSVRSFRPRLRGLTLTGLGALASGHCEDRVRSSVSTSIHFQIEILCE
jgi:hypothetical protein